MPDVKYKLTRGGTSGIDNKELVDGQILFDEERHRILLDTYVNSVLTRIIMTERDTFNGTTAQWAALSDAQKAVFTYVNFTDDYEQTSSTMIGATSSTDGVAGIVPRPMAGDEDKVLTGGATWESLSDVAWSGEAGDLVYDNTTSEMTATNVNDAIDELNDNKANISELGTAAYVDVPVSGNASSSEVVLGSDSRLTDARNAADVYDWAKAATKPSYTASEVGTYTTSEIDNMFSSVETNIDWKESVDTYNDIATTYPNPVDGWTVNVKDTDYTYRFNGTSWVAISANAIPNATTSVNGLMTTTQVTKLNGVESGAQVNTITGVKGDSENSYRTGNVNITKANIGLENVGNFKAVSTVASQGLTDTEKSNARANIGAGTSSLALGETSSTAYRGDRGKTAYTHSQTTSGNPHNVTASDVGLGNVGNFKAVSTVASQGLTTDEQAAARANIGAGTSSLALGTSSTTAYRGDRGNSAYAHAVTNKGAAFASGLYKITTNSEGHVTAATAVEKADITALGIPESDTDTIPSAICTTAAGTAAKVASCTNFVLKDPSRLQVIIATANTKAAALTLNINGTGAKSIYINNAATSSSNYTLPAGVYQVLYSGSKYYFRTDALLPGSIAGDAATVGGFTVEKAVPSNAVFTDTNTKVTSVGNHYAPAEDTSAALSADASSSTAATWGSTDLVTGVNIQRDAKGHVVGVSVDSIQMPANPNTNTVACAYCETAAGTAAKTATCTGYALLNKSFLIVTIKTANTADAALTLNVNGMGAKAIYINGSASSADSETGAGDGNHTLPAGTYLVYYNSSKYYFRTDGSLTANITGSAASLSATLALSKGGTGGTTAVAARANLVATRVYYGSTDPYSTCNVGDIWLA